MVMSSDDATIAARVLAMDVGSLLVARAFATSRAAVCWLTDPVFTSAVQASQLMGLQRRSAVSATDDGWLGVVTEGSSSCFQVDSAGVGGVVLLLKEPRSGVRAVARHAGAVGCVNWLVSCSVRDILELLGSTAGSVLGPSPHQTRTEAAPPREHALAAPCPSLGRPYDTLTPLQLPSDRAAYEICRADPVPARRGNFVVNGSGAVIVDAPTPARSPFAVWAANEEAAKPAGEDSATDVRFQADRGGRKRSARALSPLSGARSSAVAES